jgi:hypothetical protein
VRKFVFAILALLAVAVSPVCAVKANGSCSPTITTPADGSTVSGPSTLAVNPGCGAFSFIRIEFQDWHIDWPTGTTSKPWDWTGLKNGNYKVWATIWASGVTQIGTAPAIYVTVANGVATPTPAPPPPTPTPSETPTPTCTTPVITSPVHGATVSGSSTFAVNPCGAFGFIRIEFQNWHVDWPVGVTSQPWDWTGISNGTYKIWATTWANTASQIGTAPTIYVNVANGVTTPSPTPKPSATPTPAPPTPTPSATPTPTPGVAPMKVNDFLNTLGVTSHMVQGRDTAAQVQAGIAYIGVRHWRDDYTQDPNSIASICNIHAATGATYDALPDAGGINYVLSLSFDPLARCGALFATEDPNEPNNQPLTYNGNYCSQGSSFLPCGEYMRDLYTAVKADPLLNKLPMFGTTEVGAEPDNAGLQYIKIPAGAGTLMPDGTVFADYANLHNYVKCNGCGAPRDNTAWSAEATGQAEDSGFDGLDGEYLGSTWSKDYAALPYSAGSALPRVTTETGWDTGSDITEDQQGKVLVNVYLSAAKRSWAYTFIYQLMDDSDSFGLFTSSLTPKLSATYIHNLTTILADSSSSFSTTPLSYSITNEFSTVHDLLLQKSDGTFALVVWGDQVIGESDPVTVNLPKAFSVSVFDVVSGTSATQTFSSTTAVPLTITDHALILELK